MASQEAVFLDTYAQIRFQTGESQVRPRAQEKGGMPVRRKRVPRRLGKTGLP